MRGKYLIWTGAIFFLLLVVSAVWMKNLGQEYSDIPSTYNSSPRGLKALYLWLRELGRQPVRFRRRYKSLAGHSGLLVVTSSTAHPFTEHQVEQLLDWVEKGNTVLYLSRVGEGSGMISCREHSLLDALEVEPKGAENEAPFSGDYVDAIRAFTFPVKAFPLSPFSPATRGLGEMYFRPGWGVKEVGGASLPLVRDVETGYAYEIQRGAGKIYFLASSLPLENYWLNRGDNALFFLSLLRSGPREGEILFDEYHHGHSLEFGAADLTRMKPVYLALLQAFLVAGAIIFSRCRRFGTVIPFQRERQRSLLEFIRSIAILYRKAGLYREASRIIYRDFRESAAGRLGRPTGREWTEVAWPGVDPEKFQRIEEEYRSLNTSGKQTPARLLSFARAVSELKKEMNL